MTTQIAITTNIIDIEILTIPKYISIFKPFPELFFLRLTMLSPFTLFLDDYAKTFCQIKIANPTIIAESAIVLTTVSQLSLLTVFFILKIFLAMISPFSYFFKYSPF